MVYYFTYTLSHQRCEFESHSWQGVLDTTLRDKFVSYWFSLGTPVSSINKTYHHDITKKYCWKHHNPNTYIVAEYQIYFVWLIMTFIIISLRQIVYSLFGLKNYVRFKLYFPGFLFMYYLLFNFHHIKEQLKWETI